MQHPHSQGYNSHALQTVLLFRHNVKTSRRFVFENIMDLDHVCTVHKRWFRNLRVVAQTPKYVEYRLTSLFYGLRQEITARGAPIDENRYWYEFITPLAAMRVEGLLEGEDGHLAQTEKIIYRFHWLLTPAFWLLKPLFKKQKEDILHDDSALLEREYELERTAFKRVETHLPRIVVYGGDGFFGRLVVQDLLEHTRAEIVIASRNPRDIAFPGFETRVRKRQSDMNDVAGVLSAIEEANVVVSCVGPFQGQPLNILQACTKSRIPYVDVADDRDFVVRCHQMSAHIQEAGIPAFVGCSVVPGMSSLLTRYCQKQIPQMERTRIFISPGTRHPRGRGSFLCLLATVGNKISTVDSGEQKQIRGWTNREQVEFPPPMGNRWVYSVVDIADYFLQPKYFGVHNVEFKIGSEMDFLNRSLSIVRQLKLVLGMKSLDWLMPISRALILITSPFGTSQGGVMVEVSGKGGIGRMKIYVSALAEKRGEIIPAILPSVAAKMILEEKIPTHGIVPLSDWLSTEMLAAELAKRRVKLTANSEGRWVDVGQN